VKSRAQWAGRDENGDPKYDYTIPLPKLKYRGTTKLHGTNAAIGYDGENIWCQSRENLITPEADNAGFARHIQSIGHDVLKAWFDNLAVGLLRCPGDTLMIFGEWCGKGIQKKVGICGLDKMFMVFSARIILASNADIEDEEEPQCFWAPDAAVAEIKDEGYRILNINDFEAHELEIDFADPRSIQDQLEQLTISVSKDCPVAKALGNPGFGEGLVWCCKTPGWESSDVWFKTKGDDHKVSKSEKLVEIDPEKAKNAAEFCEKVLTEARLQQGLDHLIQNNLEIDTKNTGVFMKWIHTDVLKEEYDVIAVSGLEEKSIGKVIASKAREWFFSKMEV